MAKKTLKAKASGAAKGRKKTTAKTAPGKKALQAKSLARKPPTVHVAIQKVLEKMKAIVEGKKENEFLERCAKLGNDRFVIVNARLVKLVKQFVAEHGLTHDLRTSASISMETIAPSNGETCF